MHDRLEDLREHLLRAGLSPVRTRRYLGELSDHRQDLAEHLQSQGLSAAEAQREADRRLGSTDALLLPMLADPRFRSRAARWPALFFFVLPLGSQLILAGASLALLIMASRTPLRPHIPDLGQGAALIWLMAPVVIAWATWWSAFSRRAALHWPALACLATVLLANALQLHVELLPATGTGLLGVTLTTPTMLPALVLAALAFLPLLLRKAHG